MHREPQEIVTINVENKSYKVYKAFLIKDSDYFRKTLCGAFVEGQTQTINFESDITAKQFGVYVDVLHNSHFVKNFKFRGGNMEGCLCTKTILGLWKLSDRFLNPRLLSIATEAFEYRMSLYSVSTWKSMYRKNGDNNLDDRIRCLRKSFFLCKESDLPFQDRIVEAIANFPPQLYAKYHDELEPTLLTLVTQKFTSRLADPGLKRHNESGGASAKRQKQA